MKNQPQHRTAIGVALFVTFLWATSWGLVKMGLQELPPLTFAAFRYSLAFLILGSLCLTRGRRASPPLSLSGWVWLLVMGLAGYSLTPGAQFIGLARLSAQTTNFIYGTAPVLVAVLGFFTLRERPSRLQIWGIVMTAAGAYIFFPARPPSSEIGTIGILFLGTVGIAIHTILTRHLVTAERLTSLQITTISMGFGSLALLLFALHTEPLPTLTPKSLLIILWLSGVSTALPFTLWTHTLRALQAFEAGVIGNTMMVQIAVLAWVFMGERLSGREITAIVVVLFGVFLVQGEEIVKKAWARLKP